MYLEINKALADHKCYNYNSHEHDFVSNVQTIFAIISQIFEVPVYGRDGQPLSVEQLISQLRAVVQQSQVPAVAVGALTSANRDRWYSVYTEMSQGR